MRVLAAILLWIGLWGGAQATERLTFRATPAECAGCVVVLASGPIDAQAADRFAAFLADRPAGERVIAVELTSAGGHLMAALRLGRAIRAAGLATRVSSRPGCRSACAYAFLGGVSRRAEPGTLALHTASLGRPSGEGPALDLPPSARRIVTALLVAYVEDMGADAALVQLAFATPPGALRRLDRRDLAALRIERP